MIAKNSALKIQNPGFNFSFFHRWFFLIVIVATQSVLCSFGILYTVHQSWLVYNKNVSGGRFSLRHLMEANKWGNPASECSPQSPFEAGESKVTFSSNTLVVTEIYDPSKSWARHHGSFRLGTKLKFLGISFL